jgi:tRNA G18 (ribose-2'-O)-methylase SpoU
MVIESKDNKHFKEFRKLTSANGVRKYGKAIVSGRKLIKEITQSAAHSCVALIIYERYAEDDVETNTIIKGFSDAGLLYNLKKHLYNELDSFNTSAPLLVIRVPEIPEWDFSLAEGCNLLIPFQDPLNVGAVIRTAAGFGVKKIIMLKEAAHAFHPRSIKASAGAVLKYSNFPSPGGRELKGGGKGKTDDVQLYSGPSINELKTICGEHKLKIITLDMAGTPINSFTFPKTFLLLPGMEGTGVPEELNKTALSIPIAESIESLNAAVAVSIAIFSWKSSIAY